MNKEEMSSDSDPNLYVQQILQKWMQDHAIDFIKNPSDEALRCLNNLLSEIEVEVPLRSPGCKCCVNILPPTKDSPTDMNHMVLATVEVISQKQTRLHRLYVGIMSEVYLTPEILFEGNVSFDYSSFNRMEAKS